MDMLGLFILLLITWIFILYKKRNLALLIGIIALILGGLLLIHHMNTPIPITL